MSLNQPVSVLGLFYMLTGILGYHCDEFLLINFVCYYTISEK